MSKLNFFPNIKKQPQLTSHYVSKILDSERIHEPGKQSKKGRRLKTKMLHGEHENSTSEDTDQEGLTSSFQQPTKPFDDSLIALKQNVSKENKSDDQQTAYTPSDQKSAAIPSNSTRNITRKLK